MWKIVAIDFDHMHMKELLRMVQEHPDASLEGVCDEAPEKIGYAVQKFSIPEDRVFTDVAGCLEKTKPHIVILCPSPARHRKRVEQVVPYDVHILLGKPFAASLEDADKIISHMESTGKKMAVHWPLAWYPPHVTCNRVIKEGIIGEPKEVHYYDGNRGPVHFSREAAETNPESPAVKNMLWWYKKESGGGSLLDYLGYGVTLGTWFLNGKVPIEVTAMTDEPDGLEVDEHSITIARYKDGLSKFETRWGSLTDPWTHQPQPKCGFTVVGTKGSISSWDFEESIHVQTKERPEGYEIPADYLSPPYQNTLQYMIYCLENNLEIGGPSSCRISRIGQQIVEAALKSSLKKKTVPLLGP